MTQDDENMGHQAHCGARLANDNLPSEKKPYVSQASHDIAILHKNILQRLGWLEERAAILEKRLVGRESELERNLARKRFDMQLSRTHTQHIIELERRINKLEEIK